MKKLIYSITLFSLAFPAYTQFPTIETPKPAAIVPNAQIGTLPGTPGVSVPTSPYNFNRHTQRQTQNSYQQDMQHLQQMQQQQQQQTYNADFDEFEANRTTMPVLPRTYRLHKGAEHYRAALEEMRKMLTGEIPIDIKRAVFITENAYCDNLLNYDHFNAIIKRMAHLCQLKIQQKKLNPKDNLALTMTIFNFMTDTFKVKDPATEQTIVHLPMRYDFDDFNAKKDYTKYMVTKVLTQNSGQCHSLPLLYLILAKEIGAEAHWCMSVDHSFVKIKDTKGKWYNLELTSGVLLSDYHYLNSGFMKVEGIRSKSYMQPLSDKETIAEIIGDLASSFARKYGYDEFTKQCVDTALPHNPNSVLLHKAMANYHTDRAMYVIKRLGVPSVAHLPEYPQAYDMYLKMHESYRVLDDLGYEPVPEVIYQDWLQAIEREKQKPEYQKQTDFYQIVK